MENVRTGKQRRICFHSKQSSETLMLMKPFSGPAASPLHNLWVHVLLSFLLFPFFPLLRIKLRGAGETAFVKMLPNYGDDVCRNGIPMTMLIVTDTVGNNHQNMWAKNLDQRFSCLKEWYSLDSVVFTVNFWEILHQSYHGGGASKKEGLGIIKN